MHDRVKRTLPYLPVFKVDLKSLEDTLTWKNPLLSKLTVIVFTAASDKTRPGVYVLSWNVLIKYPRPFIFSLKRGNGRLEQIFPHWYRELVTGNSLRMLGIALCTSTPFSTMTIRNKHKASNSFKAQAKALKSSHAKICSTDDVLLIRLTLI